MDFSQFAGSNLDIDENKNEVYRELSDGKRVSFNPPRYEYEYNFSMTIHVNSPWFSEIQFRVNDNTIDNRGSAEYREAQRNADEIKKTVEQIRSGVRETARERERAEDRHDLPALQRHDHTGRKRLL